MKRLAIILVLITVAVMSVYFLFENSFSGDKEIEKVEQEQAEETSNIDIEPSSEFGVRPALFAFEGEGKVLSLPEGFNITIAAEDLGKARFMTMSPDGRMFIPDMVDYSLSREGSIYILSNFNEEAHKFENKTTYLTGLRGPNNVEFYTDKDGNGWIYITLTEHLIRYPYEAGDNSPSGEPEVIYEFPNEQNKNAEGIVWHITRTISFHNDNLYVSVGSGCNSCEENFEVNNRPVILSMTPEGRNVKVYAEGLKNAVGMEWVEDDLYVTENGVDHLGDDAPDDLMFKVKEGEHYGWPYCYEVDGVKFEELNHDWVIGIDCDDVPKSFTAFDPHSGSLGIEYFGENSHQILRNHFLVALQGSFDAEIGNGYQIIRVSKKGEQDVFVSGFYEKDSQEGFAKPVDVLQKDENSFFFTDDLKGKLYYVYSN